MAIPSTKHFAKQPGASAQAAAVAAHTFELPATQTLMLGSHCAWVRHSYARGCACCNMLHQAHVVPWLAFPAQTAQRVLSQVKRLARAIYSNPPTWGARIASDVINDKEMFAQWNKEMAAMVRAG